jgi:hypothetical protein
MPGRQGGETEKTERNGRLTAFSTSLGFDNHVPRPICGISTPLERVMVFLKDIVIKNKIRKENWS